MPLAFKDGFCAIVEMAKSLRREHLLIANEHRSILTLHGALKKNASEILQTSWISAHQRKILNDLLLAKSDCGPKISCERLNYLRNIRFVDIHQCKAIKYTHVLGLIELIKFVYESPKILAYCLALADHIGGTTFDMDTLTTFIVNGLYGSIIYPKDTEMMIKLLQALIEVQIVNSDNPRRLLRAGSSSFARLFQKYNESSFPAKLFLRTVLLEPIMSVLMEDAIKLELDVEKVIAMQDMSDNVKMFESKSSNEFSENSQIYRLDTVDKLSALTSKFIQSMKDGWYMFPFRTLVQSMHQYLIKARIPKADVNIILTDMIFTNFICPAILNPNIFGIIETPISENTHFNLIQIGQILQTLALIDFQPVDAKLTILVDKLDKQCLSDLIKTIYQQEYSENFADMMQHQNIAGDKMVLVTFRELVVFNDLLKYGFAEEHSTHFCEEMIKLKPILNKLPNLTETLQENPNITEDMSKIAYEAKTKAKIKGRLLKTSSSNNSLLQLPNESSKKKTSCNSLDDKGIVFTVPITECDDLKLLSEEELLNNIPEKKIDNEFIGQFAEQITLQNNQSNMDHDEQNNREKNKKISLHQDDASLCNTSDNLEAVSEAHSNHSVASSMELEEVDQNYNDNLSDMVSANVSGRGTPNISGRDTPSSQVTEGGNEVQQFATPQITKISNKTRSDIEDKFCKFEIKKLFEGDETISTISDTWSTDVLASDSEVLETNDRNFSTILIPTTPILPGDQSYVSLTNSLGQLCLSTLDLETQSEPALSTDAVMYTANSQNVTSRSDMGDFTAADDAGISNKLGTQVHNTRTSSEKGLISNLDLMLNVPDSQKEEDLPQYLHCMQSLLRQMPYTFSSGIDSRTPKVTNYSNEYNSQLHSEGNLTTSLILRDKTRNFSSSESTEPSDYIGLSSDTKPKNRGAGVNNISRTNVKFTNSLPNVPEQNLSFSNAHNHLNSNSAVIIQNNAKVSSNSVDEELSSVEHRKLSSEQRNAKFDSRRNGMMNYVGNFSSSNNFDNTFLGKDLSCLCNDTIQKNAINYQANEPTIEVASSDMIKERPIASKESIHFVDDFGSHCDDHQNKTDTLKLISSNSSVAQFSGKMIPGSITKSISFDSSANKSSLSSTGNTSSSLQLAGLKTQNGFFNKIRLGFKNRRSVIANNKLRLNYNSNGQIIAMTNCDGFPSTSFLSATTNTSENTITSEITENILSKYRRKASSSSDSTSNISISSKSKNGEIDLRKKEEQAVPGFSTIFAAAKRKLRFVLSSVEILSWNLELYYDDSVTPLLMYLRALQCQALNDQNLQQLACVSELFRCIKSFDFKLQDNLLKQMQNDIVTRRTYTQYLINCRQALLSTIDNLESLNRHLQSECHISVNHTLMVCVKMFLEKKEQIVTQFCHEFIKLTIVDEKIDLLHEFLNTMVLNLECDVVLSCLTDWQTIEARRCMECILLHRLYHSVMFPNEDGDLSRDRVLSDHISRLSRTITPSHAKLRISAIYLNEAPWPFAQKQLSYISAYKTPQEKVDCIIKCIKSLISILSMESGKSVAADDIVPVLIYVIIKCNPPNLLSTIEYVNCFVDQILQGESLYWWTQFCSAVTFIKTLDYFE